MGALLTLIGPFIPGSFGILTLIAIVAAGGIGLISFQLVGGLEYFMDLQELAMSNPTDPMILWDYIQPVIAGFLAALVVAWIIIVISVFFLRKSYNMIVDVTKVKWFGTTGLLFLIGAFTMIILIGF